MKNTLLISLVLSAFTHSFSTQANPYTGKIKSEIVAESITPNSQNQYLLGVWIKIAPGWHTYWKNPGESGLPPKVQWDTSQGLKFSEFEWPAPIPFVFSRMKSFGYKNETLLPFTVTLPGKKSTSSDFPHEISGLLKILVCKDVCVPEKIPLRFTLPPKEIFSDFPKWRQRIVQGDTPFSADTSMIEEEPSGLLAMILFAFIGGLILNLMPCVFPMISIKALEITNESGEKPSIIKTKAIAYTAGVLLTFWIFALLIFFLRNLGSHVGWGFQLQSKGFVIFLILLFHLMALNLLGVFEVGTSWMGIGNSLANKKGWGGSFFTGILSVVVASPCTAPFMGVALGYALAQPTHFALFVFTGLGLGLAFPFTILGFVPSFTKYLPKPGAWMVTFKKVLSFPLFATVAWLIWVFAQQAGHAALLQILIALVLLSLVAYLYGETLQLKRGGTKSRQISTVSLVIALITAIYFLFQASLTSTQNEKVVWEPYSKTRLELLRSQGQPVFIDFTAAWCITCQVNEKMAINRSAVMEKFKEKNVILMRGDWTNENAEITEALASYGRSGVPVYVFYGKTPHGEPRILPQILTPQIILNELEKI